MIVARWDVNWPLRIEQQFTEERRNPVNIGIRRRRLAGPRLAARMSLRPLGAVDRVGLTQLYELARPLVFRRCWINLSSNRPIRLRAVDIAKRIMGTMRQRYLVMWNKAALLGVALALALPAFADNSPTQKTPVAKMKTKPEPPMEQSNFSEGNASSTPKSFPGSGTKAAKAGKTGKASLTEISVSKNRCKQPNPPHDCVRPRPPH